MKKGVYLIPNILTLCGMFFGFYSVLESIKGAYLYAAWAIVIANIFDGLDGWVARLTRTTTKFGIELDSLSDLVAFGVAPAVLLYKWALAPFERVGWAVAFLFMICGALRLARYNVQMGSTESKSFTGLPIPGAAMVIATLVIFYYELWETIPEKNYLILILAIFLSLLMVSTLRYHGMKELSLSRRKPFSILVIIVVLFTFIVIHPSIAIFLLAMTYLFGGIIENVILLYRRRRQMRKVGAA